MRAAAAALLATLVLAPCLGRAQQTEAYRHGALAWQGRERTYLLHVPAPAGSAPLPLVIALHGASGNAGGFAAETQFAAAADAARMVVVFPDGTGEKADSFAWNAHFCCGLPVREKTDDIGFIGALINAIATQTPIDRHRVYATGMSNGAMLSHQLAAAHPEWFAAIAPVSGAIGGTNRDGEPFVIGTPKLPVAVLILHGRKDPYVLYDGGHSTLVSFAKRANMGVAEAMKFWVAADHCTAPPRAAEPIPGELRHLRYLGCRGGSEVALWEIEQGEHTWPGDMEFPDGKGGTRSAAAEILAFFAAHRRD
jgi:polyhydroxybutyrate depolymerase